MIKLSANLSPTTLLMIAGTVALLSLGQVLFKHASGSINLSHPMSLFSPALLIALIIYGAATLAWLAVLARVPLSLAFPFYGFGFVLVPFFAWLLLNEPLRWQVLAGGAVILVGVAITSMGQRA